MQRSRVEESGLPSTLTSPAMVQSYFVGVFFCVGLVAGIFCTVMLTSFDYVSIESMTEPTGRTLTADVVYNGTRGPDINRPPLSHEEVDSVRGPDRPIVFGDGHAHNDDDSVSKDLYRKVRVLCWIMTSPENLRTKAIHVNATWATRCNKVLYMSDVEDASFPAVGVDTGLGRDHLTAKTMRAFEYVHTHHLDDADWFMKADDDTYVIVENLRYMLSAHEPTEPVYFGHHFKVIVKQGYFSGGAGYVLSKEALKRFGQRPPGMCAEDQGAEDVEIGRCMEKLGVKTGDSRDAMGRSRFHCFNPETHLHGGYPDWFLQYDKYGANKGIESMSDYAVSFHYVSTAQMYDLEYYVYHLSPYGRIGGLQQLNGPVVAAPTVTTTKTSASTTKSREVEKHSGSKYNFVVKRGVH